jgi:hypothetical protein
MKSAGPAAQMSVSREAAQAASRDCPFCEGEGMIPVYHPAFTGASVGITKDGQPYVASTTAHCRCELGIWIRDRNLPEIQARIPWVEDICRGRSKWLLESPEK